MASISEDVRGRSGPFSALARMQTGAKLFFILSVALLPLALIAMLATLQTARTADQQARARLRVAVAESSRALAIELIGDMTALRVALNGLDENAADASACARIQGVFSQQYTQGIRFAVANRQGQLLCGNVMDGVPLIRTKGSGSVAAKFDEARGLFLGISGSSGKTWATVIFPTSFLRDHSRPSAFLPSFGEALVQDEDRLEISDLPVGAGWRETMQSQLGIANLSLEMTVRGAPLASPVIIALLLPLLMWLAAASIAWFVVDRLLIRPLRQLKRTVSAYVPGEVLDPLAVRALPAQEIRELGDTFRAISRTVAIHEHDLAAGLVRQTKLTKEVHHRVKNNLQVIASLINLHSRSAKVDEATDAYASIQRRVDALAVVHRNHFAEMEDNRGLPLRAILGELASNIRATVPSNSAQLGITIDIEPFYISQDVAVAVAFIVTELIELAMASNRAAQLRISAKAATDVPDRVILRVSSPALLDSETLRAELEGRYGRVLTGLARQLRSALHHDPLVGAYEISVAVVGRD